ncbi:odorant receptor 2a-like [Ptiloglossa arizonensis]|uniref:odorant receptor 2a-like n=1 Tax=Ptiloglossa arizonensis TaxID=3350558 RepID=UPI003FA0DC9D
MLRSAVFTICNKSVHCRSTQIIDECFRMILLVDLLGFCVRLGLAMYLALIKFGTDSVAASSFLLYSFVVTASLYVLSYIGEQLVHETKIVGEAFYDINWPELTNNGRKALLICLMNGQKSSDMTAGKFYVFSLFGFTQLVKTSMACLSMLRARIT